MTFFAEQSWPGITLLSIWLSFDIFCLHFSQPYLYTLVVILKDKSGRVVDCESCQVGFRKVSKAHKQLLVNGHAVVIRGVNRHEHHPEVGKANIESCMVKVLLVFLFPLFY